MLALSTVLAALCCPAAQADETVTACGTQANNVFASGPAGSPFSYAAVCPNGGPGGGIVMSSTSTVSRGTTGRWEADAPDGLSIKGFIAAPLQTYSVNTATGQYGGGFYWAGGGSQLSDSSSSAGATNLNSSYLGVQLVCGVSSCTQHGNINVGAIGLDVQETTPPNFGAPTGLWPSTGWVRGIWPFFAWSNSPSGVCTLTATLNGQLIDRSTAPSQDGSSWHQCTEQPISEPVDTSRYGQGALSLALNATDAAQQTASTSRTLDVDNQQPVVTLNGQTDAPSTSGTQFVTATATAGPSGVAGISCSVDGAPAQSYSGAAAQVPVSGVGEHAVTCTASNNAVDGNGAHGVSAPATWNLRIGVPTVTAIGFTRIVDGLRCHRSTARRTAPAHWATVVRNHRRVRVRVEASTRTVHVVRCHARITRRRELVTVTIRRHGHAVHVRRWRTIRVVLLPHADRRVIRVVRHGQGATVSGWLGTSAGVALGGEPVQILTAPDDGADQFAAVTTVTTAPDGSWSAPLPAGPGRLVEASFPGAPTAEPSTSGLAKLVVPARVQLLAVTPKRVAWGGTVHLTGRLAGGYLPTAGALVRLRIGLGRAFTTYGVHEHVTGDGRFTTTYTFGAGQPSAYRSFWFQIASLPVGDYPYAPANSRRVYVTVGGHPARRPSRGR